MLNLSAVKSPLINAAIAMLLLSSNAVRPAHAEASVLDDSFGVHGKVTTDFSNSVDSGNAMAIQSDGKIVVAGSTIIDISRQHDFAQARYNSDGSLDPSFGEGGKVTTDFFDFGNHIFAAALQGDGKIIVAGSASAVNLDFALARYDGDGKSFDFCLQEDSSGNLLQFNRTTGAYQFTNCSGFTISGAGSLTRRGSSITLQHTASDRRVMAKFDGGTNKATASIQMLSQGLSFTITDKNTANNTCSCR